MYLEKCTIRNIKCFEDITLDFRQPDGSIRLWNVLIGENGTGKSTLLQAIAIALAGQKAASVLLPRPRGWVRAGAEKGEIEATISPGNLDVENVDGESEEVQRFGEPLQLHYEIVRKNSASEDLLDDGPTIIERHKRDQKRLEQIQRSDTPQWFAAGYGPFRRLGSRSEQAPDIQIENREARFITLFRERDSLSGCTEWLMELDYASRDDSDLKYKKRNQELLNTVKEILNARLLPEDIHLDDINSRGVFFRNSDGIKILISDLSDGQRAMLALAIDLLRHFSQAFHTFTSVDQLQRAEGIVLIDELDAHLHPNWQREIGLWLKEHFPKMQFIVASHSPFIAQAADDNGLYILRRSESQANAVQAYRDETSVRGWRADQILSILFDTPSAYDPETEDRLREYGRLKILSDMGRLPEDQAQTFAELQAWVDKYLAPPGDTRAEMQEFRALDRRVQELSRMIREKRADDKG